MGKSPDEWSYGDLDAGFRNAVLVLDETFVTPDVSHQTLETRSAMAFWRDGKVYLHTAPRARLNTASHRRWLNMDVDKLYSSVNTPAADSAAKSPACLDDHPGFVMKKADAPVMMRISREEETFIGRARPGFQGRMKSASRKKAASSLSICS